MPVRMRRSQTKLHEYGTLATVHKVVKMPNQSRFVFTEGTARVKLTRFSQTEPFLMAEVETIPDHEPDNADIAASVEASSAKRNLPVSADRLSLAYPVRRASDNRSQHYTSRAAPPTSSPRPCPFLTTADKQNLLESPDVAARLEMINQFLAKEIEVQQLRTKIQTEVQDQVQQSQRDYYLRETVEGDSEGAWRSRRGGSEISKNYGKKSKPQVCPTKSKKKLSRS